MNQKFLHQASVDRCPADWAHETTILSRPTFTWHGARSSQNRRSRISSTRAAEQNIIKHHPVDEFYLFRRLEARMSYVALLRDGVSPRTRSRLLTQDVSAVEEVCG